MLLRLVVARYRLAVAVTAQPLGASVSVKSAFTKCERPKRVDSEWQLMAPFVDHMKLVLVLALQPGKIRNAAASRAGMAPRVASIRRYRAKRYRHPPPPQHSRPRSTASCCTFVALIRLGEHWFATRTRDQSACRSPEAGLHDAWTPPAHVHRSATKGLEKWPRRSNT